jgi:hypothetical protein
MFQLCFNLSRIHESVINSHALSFDPGLNKFAAKMFKELKLSAKRWWQPKFATPLHSNVYATVKNKLTKKS